MYDKGNAIFKVFTLPNDKHLLNGGQLYMSYLHKQSEKNKKAILFST